jgi:hypothetical protein
LISKSIQDNFRRRFCRSADNNIYRAFSPIYGDNQKGYYPILSPPFKIISQKLDIGVFSKVGYRTSQK